ncbi:MAG: hypothetical protein LBD22_06050 [Spirochaetaceae bacterium]|jgi:hypothetical protein|nr:hypothetical protein [Spirochaetaceae bacterium]
MKRTPQIMMLLTLCPVLVSTCTVQGRDPTDAPLPTQRAKVTLGNLTFNNVDADESERLVAFNKQVNSYVVITADATRDFILSILTEHPNDRLAVYRNVKKLKQQIEPLDKGTYLIAALDETAYAGTVTVHVERPVLEKEKEVGTLSNTYSISLVRPDAYDQMAYNYEDLLSTIEGKVALVIGNPAHNTIESLKISIIIDQLNLFLQGKQAQREYVKIDAAGKKETAIEDYIEYDLQAISRQLDLLSDVVADLTSSKPVIRIRERMFTATGAPVSAHLDPEYTAAYSLEATGASGGHQTNTTKESSALGGRGGHVRASYEFPPHTQLTVRAGSQGKGTATYDQITSNYTLLKKNYTETKPGGWPNGGSGGHGSGSGPDFSDAGDSWAPGTGGGGSTDIMLGNISGSPAVFSQRFTYTQDDIRFVVAGGGGGCAQRANSPWPVASGGDAAGEGHVFGSISPPLSGAAPNDFGMNGKGGFDNTGGDGEGNGGGGGGFKGGATNTSVAHQQTSGAGGLNHVRLGAISQEITTAATYGDGWARIAWLYDIIPSAQDL